MNPRCLYSRPRPCLSPLLSTFLLAAANLYLHPLNIHAQGGVPLWTNTYNIGLNATPNAIVVDGSNNVIVTGREVYNAGGYRQNVTIKYSNAGLPLWTNIYRGPFNNNSAYSHPSAMSVDNNGNVFISEHTGDESNSTNAIIKLSAAGTLLWVRFLGDGSGNPLPISVDTNGNIMAASPDFVGYQKTETIKYSNGGAPIWTNYYSGPNNDAIPQNVSVDQSGHVFVLGNVYVSNAQYFATVAYSGVGTPLWTNIYGPAGGYFFGHLLSLDSSGSVFVAAAYPRLQASDPGRFITIKYSNAGIPLWTNLLGSSNTTYNVSAVAVDGNANVFVAGFWRDDTDPASGWATVAYSNSGVPLWTNRYTDSSFDSGYYPVINGLELDAGGNLFMTGGTSSGGVSYFTTLGYSNAGAPLWTNRVIQGSAAGLAVDTKGNVFVTGTPSVGGYETIKYSASIPASPHLDFQRLNNHLVLSWTNAGFTLQSAPNLTATFTNIPSATSPFTNSIIGPHEFFQLKAN